MPAILFLPTEDVTNNWSGSGTPAAGSHYTAIDDLDHADYVHADEDDADETESFWFYVPQGWQIITKVWLYIGGRRTNTTGVDDPNVSVFINGAWEANWNPGFTTSNNLYNNTYEKRFKQPFFNGGVFGIHRNKILMQFQSGDIICTESLYVTMFFASITGWSRPAFMEWLIALGLPALQALKMFNNLDSLYSKLNIKDMEYMWKKAWTDKIGYIGKKGLRIMHDCLNEEYRSLVYE